MSFKVYINQGERDQIYNWVSKHKDIETGGDLFGLWLDEQTAVVQFVLGPGKDCRRTTTSFFQVGSTVRLKTFDTLGFVLYILTVCMR